MRTRLVEQLAAEDIDTLREAGHLATELGARLFLAGGAARDVALGIPHEDWDIVLEGDAPAYARALADRWHGHAVIHERFLTATVRLEDGVSFDIATARREAYPAAGALPVVEPAPIEEDLWRRDFSINAIAVALGSDDWGDVLDPTGGMDDIDSGTVRALHDRSFWDDATRIIRAIGFEQRLGFAIDPETERWIRQAAEGGALQRVSTERLGEAILPLLRNSVGPDALQRGNELGIARALGAGAAFTRRALKGLDDVLDGLAALGEARSAEHRSLACLCALLLGHRVTADAIINRLHLDRFAARGLRSAERFLKTWPSGFEPARRDGDLWGQLRECDFSAVMALWLSTDDAQVREALARYWRRLRGSKPDFSTQRLADLGYPQGPALGQALREAVRVKLSDGASADRQFAVAGDVLKQANSKQNRT